MTTPSPLPQSVPGLDLAAGCHRLGGKQALYRKLLSRFPAQYGETLQTIRATLETGDRTAAAKQAHALAGVAENLSVVDLAKSLRQLQQALQTDSNHVISLLTQAESALNEVLDSIHKLGLDAQPTTAQPSSISTESDPVGNAAWLADMEEIKALLTAHDLKARRRFAEVITHISEPTLKHRLREIGQQIEGLHFAAALSELSQVLDSWGATPIDEDIWGRERQKGA